MTSVPLRNGQLGLELNDIPFDMKDHVLSMIEDPRHLLSMALTSKEWASLIIPNHINYRVLHLRSSRQYIWPHLALRADLAKNIRRVRLMTKEDPTLEIIPRNVPVVYSTGMEMLSVSEENPMMNQALRNMIFLKSFTWIGDGEHPLDTEPIFDALRLRGALEELVLGRICPPLAIDPYNSGKFVLDPDASIWRFSNLKKLTLRGKIWASLLDIKDTFLAFLDRSPDLQELTLTYSPISPLFTHCALPNITKLHLYAESIPGTNTLLSDGIILDFIMAHPMIEDLQWYPGDQRLAIPEGLLPNVKRLRTGDRLAKLLLHDNSIPVRKMEVISQISLGPNTINMLQSVDGTNLRELHLWRFDDLEQIEGLARLFPNIKILVVPNIIQAGRNTVDDCIETLSQFPLLERYLDSSLWLSIHTLAKDVKKTTVAQLAAACPNLISLRHWKRTQNATWEIVLQRVGGEVRWEERMDQNEWI